MHDCYFMFNTHNGDNTPQYGLTYTFTSNMKIVPKGMTENNII